MRKLIDIITEASIFESEGEGDRIEQALKSLGIAYSPLKAADAVLAKIVQSPAAQYDVQFSKTKTRARDVLTEIARESGLDLQNTASTQAKDGSTWTHAKLCDGSTMVAGVAARDASRHRDHPDFGSYLHIAVAALEEEAPGKYSKKEYTDTEQRDCVKVTNPNGDVIYDGPKALFKGIEGKVAVDEEISSEEADKIDQRLRDKAEAGHARGVAKRKADPELDAIWREAEKGAKTRPVDEEITHYEQKGHGEPKPVGSLPDKTPEEVAALRKAAAKRVAAKRAARATIKESEMTLQDQIAQLIRDGLDNYSGIDRGGEDGAAYEIAQMSSPSREAIVEVLGQVESYNPYEGFDPSSIQDAANDICDLLHISR